MLPPPLALLGDSLLLSLTEKRITGDALLTLMPAFLDIPFANCAFVFYGDTFFNTLAFIYCSRRSTHTSACVSSGRYITALNQEAQCWWCSVANSTCDSQGSVIAFACVRHDDTFYQQRKLCLFICFGVIFLKFYYRKYYHFIELYQTVPFYKYWKCIASLLLSYNDNTNLSNAFYPI